MSNTKQRKLQHKKETEENAKPTEEKAQEKEAKVRQHSILQRVTHCTTQYQTCLHLLLHADTRPRKERQTMWKVSDQLWSVACLACWGGCKDTQYRQHYKPLADMRCNLQLWWSRQQYSAHEYVRPGKQLREAGLRPKHPAVIVPGMPSPYIPCVLGTCLATVVAEHIPLISISFMWMAICTHTLQTSTMPAVHRLCDIRLRALGRARVCSKILQVCLS